MSSPGLSEDRIAALVSAAQQGRLEEQAEVRPQRRAPTVRRMSFTRPTKFTHDQQRRIKRAHETFCRKASAHLGATLRVATDVEVIALSQHTWANVHAELPSSAVCAVLEAPELGTRMLLAAELGFAVAAIELMLGGSIDPAPRERRLSDVDLALTRQLFAQLTEDLSAIWQDLAHVELGLVGFESHADSAEMSLVSEPTLAVASEVRLGRVSATITLLIPYRSIEAVADRLAGGTKHDGVDDVGRQRMTGALQEVDLEVRAEVGAVTLPLDAVATLAPGDLVEFEELAADGVSLFAGDALIGRAQPGQSGGRRAVQLLGKEGR
jgi:flagellar motor switch protein FliM